MPTYVPIPGLDTPASSTSLAKSVPTPIPGLDTPSKFPLDVPSKPSNVRSATSASSEAGANLQNPPGTSDTNLSRNTQISSTQVPSSTPPSESAGRNLLSDRIITNSELDKIGSKFKVDPAKLREWLPYLDGVPENASISDAIKSGLGAVGESLGGLPQKLALTFQDPKMQDALDQVRELASSRKSYLHSLAEAAPLLAVGGGEVAEGANFGSRLLAGARTGAEFGGAFGVGESKRGEEARAGLTGAAFGGVFGAAIPAVGEVAGKVLSRGSHVPIEEVGSQIGKIQEEVPKILETQAASNKNIITNILDGVEPSKLDTEAASQVAREHLGEDVISKYSDPTSAEGKILLEKYSTPEARLTRIKPGVVEAELGKNEYESQLVNFGKYLNLPGKSAPEVLKGVEGAEEKLGRDQILSRWDDFTYNRAAEKYIAESGSFVRTDAGNIPAVVGRFASDAQAATKFIEEKYGVNLVVPHSEWNQGYYLKKLDMKSFESDLGDLIKKYGREVINSPETYADLTKPGGPSTPAGRDLLNLVEESNKWVGGEFKKAHPGVDWAVPTKSAGIENKLLPANKLPGKFDSQVELALDSAKLDKPLQTLSKSEVAKLFKSEPGSDLLRGLSIISGKSENQIKNLSGSQVSDLVDSLVSPATSNNLIRNMQLGKQVVEIPEFIRETNPALLAIRNVDDNLSKLYLKPNMSRMLNSATLVEKAGGTQEANYIRRLVSDNLGVGRMSIPNMNASSSLKFNRMLDRVDRSSDSPVVHAATSVGRVIPEVSRDIFNFAYPNMLGLRFPALIAHEASIVGRMWPELSGGGRVYGAGLVTRGATNFLFNMRTQLAKTKILGLVSPASETAIREGIEAGLESTGLYRNAHHMLETASRGLTAHLHYGYMQVKAMALSSGEALARDLAAGRPEALQVLSKLPASVKLAVQKAGFENSNKTGIIIGRYLADHTALNYNRISMSEFGRTAGPVLNMFQKWPSQMVGDLNHILRAGQDKSGALAKFAAKNRALIDEWLVPASLLGGLQFAIWGEPDKWSPRTKLFLGHGGVAEGSTAQIALDLARNYGYNTNTHDKYKSYTRPLVSPLVSDTIHDLVIKPAQARPGERGRVFEAGAIRAASIFMPNIGYVRFLTQDVPTLITGKKPEGHNFIEKSESGIKQLSK